MVVPVCGETYPKKDTHHKRSFVVKTPRTKGANKGAGLMDALMFFQSLLGLEHFTTILENKNQTLQQMLYMRMSFMKIVK